MTRTLVVGVGRWTRGDDAAGPEVVRRLRGRCPQWATIIECVGLAAALPEMWDDSERVILVDAARGPYAPGTIRRLDLRRESLPAPRLFGSTHSWGVAEAVEAARFLGRLPGSLVLYCIEGRTFQPGSPLSPEAERGVGEVVELLCGELAPASRSVGLGSKTCGTLQQALSNFSSAVQANAVPRVAPRAFAAAQIGAGICDSGRAVALEWVTPTVAAPSAGCGHCHPPEDRKVQALLLSLAGRRGR